MISLEYILIGVLFMFCVEWGVNTDKYKINSKIPAIIGWKERTIGIILWPICLIIFLYHFFKQIFK